MLPILRGDKGDGMRRHFFRRFAFLCLAAASGCADMVTGGDLIRPGEPTGIIEVENQSSSTITNVLISNCGASTYGLNRMADGYVLEPGGVYQFSVSAGCWDVDAGAAGVGEARHRMDVAAGSITRYTVTG